MSHADVVNAWFSARLRGGPLARDTPAYNQVTAALPDLVARLDASTPAQPARPPAPEAPEPQAAPATIEPAPEPSADVAEPQPAAEPAPAPEKE